MLIKWMRLDHPLIYRGFETQPVGRQSFVLARGLHEIMIFLTREHFVYVNNILTQGRV
jgi:hypothetical protein